MAGIESPFFGATARYDSGTNPCCATNGSGDVVGIHEGETFVRLYYRVGKIRGANLTWYDANDGGYFDSGYNPSVAVTDDGVVIEVHDSTGGSGGYLFYQTGIIKDSNTISFPGRGKGTKVGTTNNHGYDPSIAIVEGSSVIIVVYNTSEGIRYRLGTHSGTTVNWRDDSHDVAAPNTRATVGNSPSVSMNSSGQLVAVYENSGNLYYLVGTLNRSNFSVTWTIPMQYVAGVSGEYPSVQLHESGLVYEAHGVKNKGVYQRAGRLQGQRIDWAPLFDTDKLDVFYAEDASRPQISVRENWGVEVNRSARLNTLYSASSVRFNRATWMGRFYGAIKLKTLQDLALPASHDSGAYMSGGDIGDDLAQTQDLTLFGQLAYGARYLDLRPTYRGDANKPFDASKLYTHHGPVAGPLLTTVLDDIDRFMTEALELVILKFSHYDGFNQAVFNGMVGLIQTKLRRWLFTGKGRTQRPGQDELRLAEKGIDQYIDATQGATLVVADKEEADKNFVDYLDDRTLDRTGIYRYRDWYASDPEKGDLRVFDIYTDTTDLDEMIGSEANDKHISGVRRGQLPKFRDYTGNCQKPSVPCDLFLLSWTLTPVTGAYRYSVRANRVLSSELESVANKNRQGQVINMLYTDAVEQSRSADVAVIRNGLFV